VIFEIQVMMSANEHAKQGGDCIVSADDNKLELELTFDIGQQQHKEKRLYSHEMYQNISRLVLATKQLQFSVSSSFWSPTALDKTTKHLQFKLAYETLKC
jgi:hypothetical protein